MYTSRTSQLYLHLNPTYISTVDKLDLATD